MSRPPKLCAYCQSPGVTREHFWGRWTKKHIPHVGGYTTHLLNRKNFLIEGAVFETSKLGPMSRQGDLRSQSLKVVCAKCNSGWMSLLNKRAAPTLVRLAEDDWWPLSEDEKRLLSAWCCMFSMTYEFADRWSLASNQYERDHLRITGTAPPNWHIAIARYGSGAWSHRANHRGYCYGSEAGHISDEPDIQNMPNMNTQITVFTFGHLLIAAMSTRAAPIDDLIDYSHRFGLQSLWPLDFTFIQKPARALTDDEVSMVAYTGW